MDEVEVELEELIVLKLPMVEVLVMDMLELDVDVAVELTLPVVEDPIIEVLVVEVLLDTTAATSYMLRRLLPPQYSLALPLQTIEHPVTPGVPPPTRLEPALIVFPQKHSPEYSTPK